LETWAFAALWEKDGDGGAVVLLITAAHPTIATIHDRMPAVMVGQITGTITPANAASTIRAG
jgi:putative SOS response-associated peptidase YedK